MASTHKTAQVLSPMPNVYQTCASLRKQLSDDGFWKGDIFAVQSTCSCEKRQICWRVPLKKAKTQQRMPGANLAWLFLLAFGLYYNFFFLSFVQKLASAKSFFKTLKQALLLPHLDTVCGVLT